MHPNEAENAQSWNSLFGLVVQHTSAGLFPRWVKSHAVVCSACSRRIRDWCVSVARAGNFALTLLPRCALSYLTRRLIDPCREILFPQQGLSAGWVTGGQKQIQWWTLRNVRWKSGVNAQLAEGRTSTNYLLSQHSFILVLALNENKEMGRKLQIAWKLTTNWRGKLSSRNVKPTERRRDRAFKTKVLLFTIL